MSDNEEAASKLCRTCGDVKLVDDFGRESRERDGRSTQCRGCKAAYYVANREAIAARTKVYREASREVNRARSKTWYEANREVHQAGGKVWREANREAVAARSKAYYEANREATLARSKAWYEANKGTAQHKATNAVANHKRRALKVGRLSKRFPPTAADEQAIRDQGTCTYCAVRLDPAKVHIEHSDPLSRGGWHSLPNLVPSCADCNGRKGTKTAAEWLATDEGIRRFARVAATNPISRAAFDLFVIN